MGRTVRLKKGLDINLEGGAAKLHRDFISPSTYAIKPADFHGIKPKLLVKVGDEVKAGTPVCFDKNNPDAMLSSPVSGEVVEIVRGAKRKLLEIKVLADKEFKSESFETSDPSSMSRDEIKAVLLKSGAWPFIRMRPFAKVARPDGDPKAIFISGFDSSPLAVDLNYALEGKDEYFQMGIDALSKLTDGPVHLNLKGGEKAASAFENAQGVEVNRFFGPHPAGSIGVQIHHISPLAKGESVWYVNPQDVVTIGKLFKDGEFAPEREVALTGQQLKVRAYVTARLGACVEGFINDNELQPDEEISTSNRYISGGPLFGTRIERNGFLSFYDSQLTVIAEGDRPEFQGWLIPSYERPTLSSTFPWAGASDMKFMANTNTHGEERAFIVSGQYEKVLPMDLYPVYLLKAIMEGDIEKMEGLGIYEVAEEDMALCEFVCTSKIAVTEIVRHGLDLVEKESF